MKLLTLSERLAVAREVRHPDAMQAVLAAYYLLTLAQQELEAFLRPAQGGQLLQLAHPNSFGGAE